jgi:hypothetical protein
MSPLGEVLLATTTQFTAQCTALPRTEHVAPLPDPPPFASFVRIGPLTGSGDRVAVEDDPFSSSAPEVDASPTALFGVVFHAEIGASEYGRPLTALGLTEDELLAEQPQLFELLATRFSAALIGWSGADGAFHAGLPPRPPRPHAQVFAASQSDQRSLGGDLSWLRPLVVGERVPAGLSDELTVAALRRLWAASPDATGFPLQAGRALSRWLCSDYERLRALLETLTG